MSANRFSFRGDGGNSEARSMRQIAVVAGGVTLFAVIFSSVVLSRSNSFESSPRTGRIVEKFVSKRDTMAASSSSIVTPVHEWIERHFSLPRAGGYFETRGAGGGGHGNSKKYHVNAKWEYVLDTENGSPETRRCEMTMRDYSTEEQAQKGLKKVPIGKEKDIYVTIKHGGKYCAFKNTLQSDFNGGVAVLCVMGFVWIWAAISITWKYFKAKNASVAPMLTGGNLEAQTAGHMPYAGAPGWAAAGHNVAQYGTGPAGVPQYGDWEVSAQPAFQQGTYASAPYGQAAHPHMPGGVEMVAYGQPPVNGQYYYPPQQLQQHGQQQPAAAYPYPSGPTGYSGVAAMPVVTAVPVGDGGGWR
jgi:hypothetical protein